MHKTQLKLLGPVFHNDRELVANEFLSIPDEITEAEANRLIKLGAAKYEIVEIVYVKSPEPPESPERQKSIDEMTKLDCQNELTAAGVPFDKKAKLDELINLVSEHRNLSPADDVNFNLLNREEMENELTARAILFTSEQSDDELRQLLINDEANE